MPDPYRLPPSIAALANSYWQRPPQMTTPGSGELPAPPPTPQAFRPDPFVNNPHAQAVLHEALRVAPSIGSRLTGRIQVGPDSESTDALAEMGKGPEWYAYTPLLGTHNQTTHDISISPATAGSNDDIAGTMMHEFTHAAGYGEDEAYTVGNATRAGNDRLARATTGLR